VNRAYSILHVKALDAEKRVISGIATTPEPDRMGDIIEPLGISYKNPLPLLLFHDSKRPVGLTKFSKPTKDGIEFEARIPAIEEPGTLKDRVDEAWQSVKAGLISGVSIGFRAIEMSFMDNGGMHFLESEVVELSLVTVPANAQATITSIKQLDLAASGRHLSGVTDPLPVVRSTPKERTMSPTVQEQITSFENTRAAKVARMNELMLKAEGATLDDAAREEYTGLEREVESIDDHLPRLRKLEKTNVAAATRVVPTDTKAAAELRGGVPVVTVTPNVPKGTAFTRYVMAKVIGKNSQSDAIRYAESRKDWMDQTPEVALALKAVVNPGTIAEPAWAAPLAIATPMQQEFLELLRPATLLGKIPGLRNVPFNVSVPIQTGAGTYAWVGEGAPKPVGQLQLASTTLGIAKAAGIIVISAELAKISNPSAEMVVRNDMIKGMAQYLDTQFIDPTVAAVANVNPASITNGANGFGTAGTSGDNARTDIKKAVTLLTQQNYQISETVLIMSEANAFALSTALTSNGVLVNPGLSAKGGTILGLTTVTSQAAGQVVALVHAPSILFADDGAVNIDVSQEASVEMNTVPTSPATAASVYISLWQLNLIGLRAERFINWKRARTTAVVYTTATYV